MSLDAPMPLSSAGTPANGTRSWPGPDGTRSWPGTRQAPVAGARFALGVSAGPEPVWSVACSKIKSVGGPERRKKHLQFRRRRREFLHLFA